MEGTLFLTRTALFDSGVHRQKRAGIAGGAQGAESVLLSGGYENDQDQGNTILYTGQGGVDPETGKQRADQILARGNTALVRSIAQQTPVRVIRGAGHAHPLSPPVGYLYAGLYHVAWAVYEPGKSGFWVWRFALLKLPSA